MSSPTYKKYFDGVLAQMQQVMDNELEKIEQAAVWMAEEVRQDKLIHVYGTGGHNFMIACEMFNRAGSLLNYNIIIPGGTPCFQSNPSTENLPGLAAKAMAVMADRLKERKEYSHEQTKVTDYRTFPKPRG